MNPIICELCNKTFQRKSHLEEHKNRKTPCIGKLGNFECEYCDRSYTSESGLRYHYENCDVYREIKRMKVPKKIRDEIIILPHQNKKKSDSKIIVDKIIKSSSIKKKNVLTVMEHDDHKIIKKLTKKDAAIKERDSVINDLKNELKLKDLENEIKIKDLQIKDLKIKKLELKLTKNSNQVVNNIQNNITYTLQMDNNSKCIKDKCKDKILFDKFFYNITHINENITTSEINK